MCNVNHVIAKNKVSGIKNHVIAKNKVGIKNMKVCIKKLYLMKSSSNVNKIIFIILKILKTFF